jgi:hypothetical protein
MKLVLSILLMVLCNTKAVEETINGRSCDCVEHLSHTTHLYEKHLRLIGSPVTHFFKVIKINVVLLN